MEIIVTSLVSSLFTTYLFWYWKIYHNRKIEVFEIASKALADYWSECLDVDLQNSKPSFNGKSLVVNIRKETSANLQHAKNLVQLYYPKSYNLYEKAANSLVGIENIPNELADKNKKDAINSMINERRFFNKNWKAKFWIPAFAGMTGESIK
jgi:type II secretory pathway component GspD/PulD (secretin)